MPPARTRRARVTSSLPAAVAKAPRGERTAWVYPLRSSSQGDPKTRASDRPPAVTPRRRRAANKRARSAGTRRAGGTRRPGPHRRTNARTGEAGSCQGMSRISTSHGSLPRWPRPRGWITAPRPAYPVHLRLPSSFDVPRPTVDIGDPEVAGASRRSPAPGRAARRPSPPSCSDRDIGARTVNDPSSRVTGFYRLSRAASTA
jgi:hypothetical protein